MELDQAIFTIRNFSVTNVTSISQHLIILTSDTVASISDFKLSSLNGPIMSSKHSQVTFDRLSIRKLRNNVDGISIFDFSNSQVMVNNSIIEDIEVRMKSSYGAEIIHLKTQS